MNAARAGVQGFSTHGFSAAFTALIVLALVVAVAFFTEGPWWQRLLAGLGTYVVYAALLLGSSWLVIGIFVAGVKRKERQKQRVLRKILALARSGDRQAAAAHLAPLAKPESWVEHYDDAFRREPELAKEYAAAAREAGELRGPLLQVLLQHAPWHPEVAAVLADSLETFDAGQLRRWLRWMGLHAPREPERERRIAAEAERVFARLDEAQRRYTWREMLPEIQEPAAWQRLAGIYAEDLRGLEALADLSAREREGMRKLRSAPGPEPTGAVC